MSSVFESIFGRSINPRQLAIIGVGVAVTAGIVSLANFTTKPVLIPLFAGLPIESVSDMTAKLTELGITYELDRTGTTIMVHSEDQAEARVQLAKEGYPNAGRPGMELFDKPTWGMTDFTQKVNYGRALQGELERTIGAMRGVEKVQVHLALEDEALFKQNERPSKASVTLKMKGGESPTESMVRGVASLVAGSIGGLDPQHVTILDERGHAMQSDDDGSVVGLTSRQLTVQREIESSLEKKAETLLNSLVGSGNSKVQVTASVNFDKLERTIQAVDPEKQVTSTEQKAEVLPGSPQQGAGYNTNTTTYENSRSVENFVAAIGTLRKLTVAVLVADKVTIPQADSGAKTAPAPIITARTPDEVARIEALMRNALGVDSARGDLISVVSAPFDMPAPEVFSDSIPEASVIQQVQNNPLPFVGIAGVVALLILAIVIVMALKPKKVVAPVVPELAAAPRYPELPASPQMAAALQSPMEEYMEPAMVAAAPRPVVLPAIAVSPEREQAIATVDQRPEAAVRVTRNWLRT